MKNIFVAVILFFFVFPTSASTDFKEMVLVERIFCGEVDPNYWGEACIVFATATDQRMAIIFNAKFRWFFSDPQRYVGKKVYINTGLFHLDGTEGEKILQGSFPGYKFYEGFTPRRNTLIFAE